MQTDLIVISEYCQNCHVDPSFIKMLESEGLISLQTIEDEKYIVASELRELEQYRYDTSFAGSYKRYATGNIRFEV